MAGIPKLIVIDDQRQLGDFIKITLKGGYDVHVVNEKDEALKRMDTYQTDLVLINLRSPEIKGIKTLEELKKKSSETEVIIMAAYASIETVREAFRLGAFGFLMKPFDADKLVHTVNSALRLNTFIR